MRSGYQQDRLRRENKHRSRSSRAAVVGLAGVAIVWTVDAFRLGLALSLITGIALGVVVGGVVRLFYGRARGPGQRRMAAELVIVAVGVGVLLFFGTR